LFLEKGLKSENYVFSASLKTFPFFKLFMKTN
jgi:hypothetical protein